MKGCRSIILHSGFAIQQHYSIAIILSSDRSMQASVCHYRWNKKSAGVSCTLRLLISNVHEDYESSKWLLRQPWINLFHVLNNHHAQTKEMGFSIEFHIDCYYFMLATYSSYLRSACVVPDSNLEILSATHAAGFLLVYIFAD